MTEIQYSIVHKGTLHVSNDNMEEIKRLVELGEYDSLQEAYIVEVEEHLGSIPRESITISGSKND